MDAPRQRAKRLKIAGFDLGRNYVAWAVVRGTYEAGFYLYRHGLLYPPDLGDTQSFGSTLPLWSSFFQVFVARDLKPAAYGLERFVHRPGNQGAASEDINLRIPGMMGPSAFLVRNTDWKGFFHRNVDPEGTHHYFKTQTEHEADAAGIALYVASVALPRSQRNCATGRTASAHL